MKNAILTVVAVTSVYALFAFAADVRVATLTTPADGGVSNAGTMGKKLDYGLQCAYEACYKTGTSAPTPDCTLDYVLPLVGSHYVRDFNAGNETSITVKATVTDGGNADCHLYQRTK